MTTPSNAASYQDAFAITPSDVNDVWGNAVTVAVPAKACQAIWVGVTGNIAIVTASGRSVTLLAVPVGLLPIAVQQVKATGTTATTMVALS